jgi:acetolactate synthase I/III small subunit
MENNNEKKLYTLLVYSENIAGILNQITAVFTRRQVNIESLNVSASSIKKAALGLFLFSECKGKQIK